MNKNNFASVDVIMKEDTSKIKIVPLTKKGLPSKIGYSTSLDKANISRIYIDDKLVYGERSFLYPIDNLIEVFGPGLVYVIRKAKPNSDETVEIFESHWGQLHNYHFQSPYRLEVVGNTVISTVESFVYHTKLRDNYGRRAGIQFDSATYLDENTLIVIHTEKYGISEGIKTVSYIDTETFEIKKTRKFFEGIEL